MYVRSTDQPEKIPRVRRDEDAILFDTSPQDGVVELTTPPNVARV